MAIDEWMMESVSQTGIPVIRIYQWAEPTLSLGYFQQYRDREQHLASRNCACVRRHSGGGAIMHDRELTYSVVMPDNGRWFTRHDEVYQATHTAVIGWLAKHHLGASRYVDSRETPEQQSNVSPAPPSPATESRSGAASQPFLCFQRRSDDDLVVQVEKVLGSAQRRRHGVLLQHGSLLLQRSEFAPELPGLFDLGGQDFDLDQSREVAAVELSEAICAAIGIEPNDEALRQTELDAAEKVSREKFGNSEWTERR